MKIYYDSNGDGTENALVTNVISFPTMVSRMDKVGTCSFSIRDKLGALYATWKDYDFRKVKIEDDNSNVLFRGYIVEKTFTHNTLTVILKGIGIKLEWTPFNKNYILEEGFVKNVPSTHEFTQTFNTYPTEDAIVGQWVQTKRGTNIIKR